MEARTRAKLEKEGWEFVSQKQSRVQTTLVFRKPNTKVPRALWIGLGGVLVVLFVFIGIMAAITGGDDEQAAEAPPGPTATVEEPSVAPSSEPTVAPAPVEPAEPAVTPATDEEILALFQAFFDERKAAGVTFAQAITGVSFANRTLSVTFDSAAVGMDWAAFDYLTPFADNYANFVITPMAFNDDIGPRLRASVDNTETFQADGVPRGTVTTAEVIRLNELE